MATTIFPSMTGAPASATKHLQKQLIISTTTSLNNAKKPSAVPLTQVPAGTMETPSTVRTSPYYSYLHQPLTPPLGSGYLTRRFRRIVTGNTLSEVMDKQITMPVWIPAVLDDYIATLTTPSNDEHRILIPAYNTRYKSRTTAIPPLPDKSRTGWRLRIWVIGNETMWARAHSREIDEVFEILWTLYHLAWTAGEDALRLPPRNADVDWEVACAFADRLERRPVPKVPEEEVGAGWIDQVEIQRWNEWLMDEPQRVMGRNYTTGHHWLFADTARLVPKEEWYWDGEVLEAERGVWTDAPEVQILEWADAKEATEEEGRGSPLRKRRRIGAAGSSYDDE